MDRENSLKYTCIRNFLAILILADLKILCSNWPIRIKNSRKPNTVNYL